MNGDPELLFQIFRVKTLKIITENIMNFYQLVFLEKKLFRKYSEKKSDFGVITLQYLPFLVRAINNF